MILVTGATGLVGGHLIWHLLSENSKIVAICRKTSNQEKLRKIFSFYTSQPDLYLQRVEWRTADVLDLSAVLKSMEGINEVYHCAAVVSIGKETDLLLDTNIIGTKNMLQAAMISKVRKFCFVSSIAACGKSKEKEPIDENSVWEDSPLRSAYSRSKYYSEQEVWKAIQNGLSAVIVNPGVILGYSGINSGSSQLFSQVKKGLMFYTDGGSGYVDVKDVAKAMILLMKSNVTAERFIVAGENCSNKEILTWMADGFQKPKPVIKVGKKLLFTVGYIAEMIAKVFRINVPIDRDFARTASNREFYSSKKLIEEFQFEFNPVEVCIQQVCRFMESNQG